MEAIIRAKPRFYTIPVTVGKPAAPVLAGDIGRASVTIQDLPFILKKITWCLLSFNGLLPFPTDPISGLVSLIPDGHFMISFKTDNHVYSLEPIQIAAAFGSGFGFQWQDLPSPVELRPKTTFTVELTTMLDRHYPVTVQLLLHGMEPDQAPLPPAMQNA
jgi:hypothetical protein